MIKLYAIALALLAAGLMGACDNGSRSRTMELARDYPTGHQRCARAERWAECDSGRTPAEDKGGGE